MRVEGGGIERGKGYGGVRLLVARFWVFAIASQAGVPWPVNHPCESMLRITPLLLLLVLTSCAPDITPERPNIVLLFADDQRADAIAAYGNEFIKTPTLDRLAATGMNFRDAHVMGSIHGAVCQPSRAMLMTGRSLYHVYAQLDTVHMEDILDEGATWEQLEELLQYLLAEYQIVQETDAEVDVEPEEGDEDSPK